MCRSPVSLFGLDDADYVQKCQDLWLDARWMPPSSSLFLSGRPLVWLPIPSHALIIDDFMSEYLKGAFELTVSKMGGRSA